MADDFHNLALTAPGRPSGDPTMSRCWRKRAVRRVGTLLWSTLFGSRREYFDSCCRQPELRRWNGYLPETSRC